MREIIRRHNIYQQITRVPKFVFSSICKEIGLYYFEVFDQMGPWSGRVFTALTANRFHLHTIGIRYIYIYIWVFPKIGVPQNGWFIRETPIKMDDLGLPLFSETPIYSERVGYWEHGSTIPTQLTLEPLKPTGVERFHTQNVHDVSETCAMCLEC